MEAIDPKPMGLPARTNLFKAGPKTYVIRIDRKSRIIMKDAKVLLEKARKIIGQIPKASVHIETTAPVCSKSIRFLKKNKIEVVQIDCA